MFGISLNSACFIVWFSVRKQNWYFLNYIHSNASSVSSSTDRNLSNPYAHSYGISMSCSLKESIVKTETFSLTIKFSLYFDALYDKSFIIITLYWLPAFHFRFSLQHVSVGKWQIKWMLVPNIAGFSCKVHMILPVWKVNKQHKLQQNILNYINLSNFKEDYKDLFK